MPDRTINFISPPTTVKASTITDFYQRLNAIRTKAGVATVSFTSPLAGNETLPDAIEDVEDNIQDLVADVHFDSVVPSIFQPAWVPNVESDDLMEAKLSVHRLEKQVGELERACVTDRSTNRTAFNATNFGSNASGSGCNPFTAAGFCSPHVAAATGNSTVHSGNGTSCSGYFSAFFSGRNGSVKTAVHGTNRSTDHSTFRSGYFKTYRQYVNTSFHGGHGCNTWGSNYTPKQKTFHATFFGTQNSQKGTAISNCSANNGTVFGTFCNAQHNPYCSSVGTCSTVFQATFFSFNQSNLATQNTANFSVVNSSNCTTNWGTFNVTPL